LHRAFALEFDGLLHEDSWEIVDVTIIKIYLEGTLNCMLFPWVGLLHHLGGLLWLVLWGGMIGTFIVFLLASSQELK
jgi:hypothetical protein